MVNVHQTNTHHSLEENRLLPALLRGVIIVSEEVPLVHTIPYHEYLIFCPYDDIAEVAEHVHRNYEFFFERIHGPRSRLPQVGPAQGCIRTAVHRRRTGGVNPPPGLVPPPPPPGPPPLLPF